jgi:hypothetical protein
LDSKASELFLLAVTAFRISRARPQISASHDQSDVCGLARRGDASTGETLTRGIQNPYGVKKSKNLPYLYNDPITFSRLAGKVIQERLNGKVRKVIEGSKR